MVPTMSEFPYFDRVMKNSKSFLIEDLLNLRRGDDIYTGVEGDMGDNCNMTCYEDDCEDGKRSRGPRKDRTIFTKIQLFRLERRFHDQKYLSSYEKALIAHSLHLTQQQVQTWFQNRRAKAKREEREKKKQGVSGSDRSDKACTSPHPTSSPISSTASPISPVSTLNADSLKEGAPLSMLGQYNSSPRHTLPPSFCPGDTSSLLTSPVMKIVQMVNNPTINISEHYKQLERSFSKSPLSLPGPSSHSQVIVVKPQFPKTSVESALQKLASQSSTAQSTDAVHKFSIHRLTSSDNNS